jgi:hypothetical protein
MAFREDGSLFDALAFFFTGGLVIASSTPIRFQWPWEVEAGIAGFQDGAGGYSNFHEDGNIDLA